MSSIFLVPRNDKKDININFRYHFSNHAELEYCIFCHSEERRIFGLSFEFSCFYRRFFVPQNDKIN